MLIRLAKDRRGVSAVEFALIAPLLVSFYFGMTELTQALLAERRASHAASAIGDLVAQSSSLTSQDVTDIFEIGDQVVKPFPYNTLRTCVVAIKADTNGVPKVDWVKSNRSPTGCPAKGATVALPANLITANQGLIQAEVQYSYVSPINYVLPSPITFTEKFYLRPRASESVTLT